MKSVGRIVARFRSSRGDSHFVLDEKPLSGIAAYSRPHPVKSDAAILVV